MQDRPLRSLQTLVYVLPASFRRVVGAGCGMRLGWPSFSTLPAP